MQPIKQIPGRINFTQAIDNFEIVTTKLVEQLRYSTNFDNPTMFELAYDIRRKGLMTLLELIDQYVDSTKEK